MCACVNMCRCTCVWMCVCAHACGCICVHGEYMLIRNGMECTYCAGLCVYMLVCICLCVMCVRTLQKSLLLGTIGQISDNVIPSLLPISADGSTSTETSFKSCHQAAGVLTSLNSTEVHTHVWRAIYTFMILQHRHWDLAICLWDICVMF